MKKLVIVLFVLAVNLSTFANASKPMPEVKKEIRNKIIKLLGEVEFEIENNLETTIDLLINKKGEIVILDVKTKNNEIKDFVTQKLNYKKVTTDLNQEVTIFKMPLKVVK